MNLFKKKLATFSALLAFVTVSCSAVYAVTSADVIGKTGNMNVVDTSATRTDINLVSRKVGDVGQVDWSKFNVAKGERVNFGFSNVSQTIVNRVLGGQQSKILGQMTNSCTTGSCQSNVLSSKVIMINPAGIMFGPGSQIDLNSFTASTHDINGIKNLNRYTQEYIDSTYQTNVLNKMSPTASVNGTNKNTGYIKFDSNYTSEFDNAGISYTKGGTAINLDQAKFAHFNTDADGNLLNTYNEANPNKSVNIVSDNITYKDSIIKTGNNFNYITKSNGVDWRASNSNVKLITADGVTFGYVANGYTNGAHTVAADTKTNAVRKIDMDNSGLAEGTAAIQSGEVVIKNISNAAGSNIKIKDTAVKGMKLLAAENGGVIIAPGYGGEYGNITIDGTHDVLVDHSRLESVNTSAKNANDVTETTFAQAGGEIYINAGKNATVKNSLVKSASLDEDNYNNTTYPDTSSMVRVYAGEKATVDGSRLISQADANIVADKNIEVKNSLINAKNSFNSKDKEVLLYAPDEIKVHNGVIKGSNILAYATDSNGAMSGNVTISSDSDSTDYTSAEVINGQDKSLLQASNKVSLQGKNTKIDNSSLTYKEIKFYNDGFSGQNDVTVANNSTFSPIVNGSISRDINLETNGNFTLDKATIKAAATKISTGSDAGTIDSVPYQVQVKAAKANNISVTSTEKDVIVKNNSDVNANLDVNLTSQKGSVNIDNSKVNGGQDVNVTAYNTIAFGTGKNITPTADIEAGRNVNITSTNGDITGEKTDMPEIKYGNKLKFDAKKNNIFTSQNSLKSVNVDYVAGESNRIYTTGDAQFVNSSLKAPNNFVESGHDVIANNLEIKTATADPKDTKTQIFANGNVTTDNVTNEDLSKVGGTYPQSVAVDRTGTGRTTLNVNKTKLAITTETVKDSTNPDNGTIKLDVANADNNKAGLELTAVNVKALDQDPTTGYFKQGYYKAGTPEWDNNIAPKEGPEVKLNATDNKVAIAGITTDKLNLDPNDNIIADNTNGTPKLEVKDQGGLNLDPTLDYNPDKTGTGFTYDQNYRTKDEQTTGGILTYGDWSEWKPTGREWTDPDGTKHTEYYSVRDGRITDKITTKIDQEHKITFDNQGNPSEFTLVYDKKDTTVEPGRTIKGEDVKDDPSIVPNPDEFFKKKIEDCENPPVIEPESYINQIRLPREQTEVSRTSRVADNTVDQTNNVMAAAARVDLSQDDSDLDADDND